MQRLFHYAFLGIIGLSLAVQTLQFGAAMSGSTHVLLESAVEQGGLVVMLGSVVAFLKLLLNLVRGVRQPAARLSALCYGLILVWPLVLLAIGAGNAVSTQAEPPLLRETGGAVRRVPEPRQHVSAQFLAGQAWAQVHSPAMRSECQGSEEFIRGCFVRILEARKEQETAGHEWASQNRPRRVSACKGDTPHFVLGCHKWYMEQSGAARTWPFGATTTEECREEVNANYEAAHQLYLAEGNEHGAEVNRHRHWIPDLQSCEQVDRKLQDPMMAQAYARLSTLVEKMRGGARPTGEEQAAFKRDYTEMAKVPDQPYKEAYLKLANEYLERMAGTDQDNLPQ
ncbi:hypothetical protein [Caldimonas brevitalea]|nr:hypothetical protein [Caldimonas brevitalea]